MRTDTDIYMWDVATIKIERNDTKGTVTITFNDKAGEESRAVTVNVWGPTDETYKYAAPEIIMVETAAPEPAPELIDEEPDV